MDIIKKNLWSIIWGVVAILCLIVPFWPMGAYHAELKTQADARASVYNDLVTLLNRRRSAPVIDPNNPREADLGMFPNDTLIKNADEALTKLQRESKNLQAAAEVMSETGPRDAARQPLVPEALPKRKGGAAVSPPVGATQYRFKDRYLAAAPTEILNLLNAGMPPTVEQITAAKTAVEASMRAEGVEQANIDAAKQAVAAKLKLDVATEKGIYADPSVFPRHADMDLLGGAAPSLKAIWNAQLWHWIQEDIAQAIANVNSGGKKEIKKDIRTSPIKRIRSLTIEVLDKDPIKWSLSKSADGKLTDYKPDEDAIPKKLEVSSSGRVSCGLYDVIRFRLDMDVDATKMTSIIQGLSQKNFLNVLAVQHIHPIDRAVEQAGDGPAGGYIYGDSPVVNIIVDCEMLYMRSWTVPYMPEDVKREYTEGVQARIH